MAEGDEIGGAIVSEYAGGRTRGAAAGIFTPPLPTGDL